MQNAIETPLKGLIQKNFLLVVVGQIISLFGNGILRFALPLYILQVSGSPALFGLVSAISFIPMVIMSPIGGILADRVNKKMIMVVLDTATALIMGAFLLLWGSIEVVPLVIVTMVLLYGIQGAYSPSVQASIPALVRQDKLLSANAAVNLVQSLAGLLGPVIGGILFAQFGLLPILVVGCICFAFSAFIELFIRIPYRRRKNDQGAFAIVKGDMKDSVGFIIKEQPVMMRVIILVFAMNLVMSSMLIIGMPVIITGYLDLGSDWYGMSQGTLAVGGLLGGLLAGALSKKLDVKKAYVFLFVCALCIVPMAIVLMSGLPALVIFIVLSVMGAVIMACSTIFSIQMLAFVQGQVPEDMVGKVIAFVIAISTCAQPIGQALFGLLFESFAMQPGIVVLASAAASMAIALFSKSTFGKLDTQSKETCEVC